ncbi:MAG: glutathione S- transferase, nitrogen catabolite repression regulator [Phylliscum demangeonii]|nr:MAG: glutathione S- transferase, nitrogen catabolite repression regulator [Phylliscum demangeonii]
MKPILVYMHASGPNPWKVVIVLEELSIPYETKYLAFPDMKKPPYESVNPNGRVPAIEDPNTGITIWESNAVVTYLVDKYDKESKLTFKTEAEKYHVLQWLFFQASGQGPYFGQAAWFIRFHSEPLPSARERYLNEIKRVIAVFNRALEGHQYLVGDKVTIADLVTIPWNNIAGMLLSPEDKAQLDKDNPNYLAWYQRLVERPAVKKAFALREQAMKDHPN